MIHLSRRSLLKGIAAAGTAGAFAMNGLSNLVFAAEPAVKAPILVVIHLRGGCDGLQFISPASDPDFIAARASDLRVAADGQGAGFALVNGPAPHIDFRLHASASGLAELYKGGSLAFIHAAGLTDSTRSHFVATDMIERGVGSEADLLRTDNGWLARALEGGAATAQAQAVSTSGTVPGDLAGLANALVIPGLKDGLPFIGGSAVSTALWQMYSADAGPLGAAGRLALQLPETVDEKIPRDPQGRILAYAPEKGADYGPAAELAQPLKTVAQLIKMDIGLQAITVDFGGFDTHEGQAGRFRPLMEKLSGGLAGFWNDMAAYHDRITVVTVTEFGRRLRSNNSNGTDHGRASVMMVLGGGVLGGRFYGSWPGLHAEELEEGVDLAVATDYRRVLTEILQHRQPAAKTALFPNYTYPGPMGIFGKA